MEINLELSEEEAEQLRTAKRLSGHDDLTLEEFIVRITEQALDRMQAEEGLPW